jgi:quercetin dioxygenase-like cupin family protein
MSTTATTEYVWFIDNLARIRLSGDETEGRLALLEMEAPRGHMPPLHVHHAEDETFVLLDGEVTLYVGSEVLHTTAGNVSFAPRGVPHTFRVESESARWFVVATPSGFDRFVRTVGAPAADAVLPPEPVLPDPERFAAICEEFDVELLGPPGTLPS